VTDRKIELYNAAIRDRFTFVVNVAMTANPGGLPSVEVVLMEDAAQPRESHLAFQDATDIVLGDINRGSASHIEIRDIREKKLEHIQYDVVDTVGNMLKLKCWDFTFSIGDKR
jgi:hypothetical protein